MRPISRNRILTVFLFIAAALAVKEVMSYASGAPPGFTGSYADGGSTCVTCHTGATATPMPGWITSNIPPTGYVPGNTYTITAQAVMNGHVRFGFEISPMDSFGSVIGTLTDINAETEVIGSGVYVTHSFIGTSGLNSKAWTFDWTAPNPGVGNVTFYGAFNVADDNGSNSQDTIFTSTYTVQENISTGLFALSGLSGVRVYPNPARAFFQIALPDPFVNKMTVSMFDIHGALAMDCKELAISPGSGAGVLLPEGICPGVYFVNILTPKSEYVKRVVILE